MGHYFMWVLRGGEMRSITWVSTSRGYLEGERRGV